MKHKNLKEKYRDDPDQALIDELLDVIERTRSTSEKLDAIKMIEMLRNEHIC